MRGRREEINLQEIKAQAQLTREERAELDGLRELARRFAMRRRIYMLPRGGQCFRFAFCADIHVGSTHEQRDAFAAYIDFVRREKIRLLLVAGDIIDGDKVYRGQEYEVYAHGMEKQIAELGHYAKITRGLDVRFIAGNHDMSYHHTAGVDVGGIIAHETGWRNCGDYYASFCFPLRGSLVRVDLAHPSGTGAAYAISYRPQKIVESLTGGQKPDVLCIGHYHKSEMLPSYRNIIVFQAGCFQSQTPFLANKGIAVHLGGWIAEIEKRGKTFRVRPEFLGFYD